MSETKPLSPEFQKGEEVELVAGSYQGTLGVFVGFREDAKWADIAERDGEVRSHPVEWLRHARGTARPDVRTPEQVTKLYRTEGSAGPPA